jgi:hypothetical protein
VNPFRSNSPIKAVAVVYGFFAVLNILEVCLGISIYVSRYVFVLTFVETRSGVIELLCEFLHALEGTSVETARVGEGRHSCTSFLRNQVILRG